MMCLSCFILTVCILNKGLDTIVLAFSTSSALSQRTTPLGVVGLSRSTVISIVIERSLVRFWERRDDFFFCSFLRMGKQGIDGNGTCYSNTGVATWRDHTCSFCFDCRLAGRQTFACSQNLPCYRSHSCHTALVMRAALSTMRR